MSQPGCPEVCKAREGYGTSQGMLEESTHEAGSNRSMGKSAVKPMVAVAAGLTCALSDSGDPACFGSDRSGRITNLPQGVTLTSIALGERNGCGVVEQDIGKHCSCERFLDDDSDSDTGAMINCRLPCPKGSALCWGSDQNKQISHTPQGVTFQSISVAKNNAIYGLVNHDSGKHCDCKHMSPGDRTYEEDNQIMLGSSSEIGEDSEISERWRVGIFKIMAQVLPGKLLRRQVYRSKP